MKRDSTTNPHTGKKYAFWRCNARERCTARASIGAERLETYVEKLIVEAYDRAEGLSFILGGQPPAEDEGLDEELLAAEEELRSYVAATSAADLGPELFREGLTLRQERVNAARAAIAETATPPAFEVPEGLEDELQIVQNGWGIEYKGEALKELFRNVMSNDMKRILYGELFERIEVSKGRGPVEERVKVVLRSTAP
jgi:hypothetical protein